MPRGIKGSGPSRKATPRATKAAQKAPVKGVVKATSASLVGRGTSGNESLANRVEEAMNTALETAIQRGEKDPKKLLQAKIGARKEVLDAL